jgi:glycosyltransferase involved in cell wall biosynthesis/GT2 family glycosyltransferase
MRRTFVGNLSNKIAIITPDIVGFVRNGGVGTACAELARAYAALGHSVTVFYTQANVSRLTIADFESQHRNFAEQGIDIIVAEDWARDVAFPPSALGDQVRKSAIVHDWLKSQCFGTVFFMDWQGNGYYSLLARNAGIAHKQHGAFVLISHGPTLWSTLGSAAQHRQPKDALTYFIERKSIELADVVVSPSQYLLDWMSRYGFKLPPARMVLPNLLSEQPTHSPDQSNISEIVFFGRLEHRKGLLQFCDAIDLLLEQGGRPQRVIFLGKFGHVGNEHAAIYLARRTAHWGTEVIVQTRLNQPEALAYLRSRPCIAVVPSTIENSPYTVYECIATGIPVLARDTGGIRELFDEESRNICLFGAHPRELARSLRNALENGAHHAKLPFTQTQLIRQWESLLAAAPRSRRDSREATIASPPRVSVCMAHHRRPAMLAQALDSIREQCYSNFELILVDDGSHDPATTAFLDEQEPDFAARGWTILRTENDYPGRARNRAAELASGDYLLFMDDDNIALPSMISILVEATVTSGADITTCFASIFEDGQATSDLTAVDYLLPVGGGLGYALENNALSDTHALVKTEVFHTIGGFTEDFGVGHEDFEFFLKASLRGFRITIAPERLYWYRRQKSSITGTTQLPVNRARSLRPLLEQACPDLRELLVVAHGMAHPIIVDDKAILTVPGATAALLADHDPDSYAAIDSAAAVLLYEGQYALALQLLDQISAGAPKDLPRSIRLRLVRAVLSGSDEELQAALTGLNDQIGLDDTKETLALCVFIAEKENRSNEGPLLQKLVQFDADNGELRLKLSLQLCDKNPGAALEQFIMALGIAEATYLRSRPDVVGAVRHGDFAGGLDHYCKHGKQEGSPWQQEELFEQVATRLSLATPFDLGSYSARQDDIMKILHFFRACI